MAVAKDDKFPVESADPEYDRSICLWLKANIRVRDNSLQFYALNMCSSNSKQKEEEDRQKEELEKIFNNNNIRGPRLETYLSFHHYKRHDAEVSVPVLPLLQEYHRKEKPKKDSASLIAVMGSNLYSIGGSRRGIRCPSNTHLSRKVIYFDIIHGHDHGWKKAPPMISGRRNNKYGGAQAVALNGKLYVFGGRPLDADHGHWAEVFDPENENNNNWWTPLPPPPVSPFSGCDPFAAILDSDTILLGSSSYDLRSKSFLFTYHVIAKCWKSHDDDDNYSDLRGYLCGEIGRRRRFGAPVVVGSTVYWVGHCIYAYDLDEERFYDSGPITDLSIYDYLSADSRDDDRNVENPILLHLAGDLFCLIWLSHLRCPVNFCRSLLHCTKFRIYKGSNISTQTTEDEDDDDDDDMSTESESLFAFVHSCRSYAFENDQVSCLAGYQFN